MKFIAIILPALIDTINRRITDSDARFWVSVLVCSIFGIGFELLENGFVYVGYDPFVDSILLMFGIAQIVYKGIYEDSKIQNAIRGKDFQEKIEIEVPTLK